MFFKFSDKNNNQTANKKADNIKLQRKLPGSLIAGVCGGLAEYFAAPVLLIRIIFLLLLLWGGIGLAVYLALIFIIKPGEIEENGNANNELFSGLFLLLTGLFFSFKDSFIWTVINVFGLSDKFAAASILISFSIILFDRRNFLFVKNNSQERTLTLSSEDKKLSGVIGGLSLYFNLNPNFVRMLWIIFTFATAGFGALIYAVLAINMRPEDD